MYLPPLRAASRIDTPDRAVTWAPSMLKTTCAAEKQADAMGHRRAVGRQDHILGPARAHQAESFRLGKDRALRVHRNALGRGAGERVQFLRWHLQGAGRGSGN